MEAASIFAGEASYKVMRTMTCDGVKLEPGDFLPKDAAVRKDRIRLEALCRQRKLVPAGEEVPKSKKKNGVE
jgi:hypothetical protein